MNQAEKIIEAIEFKNANKILVGLKNLEAAKKILDERKIRYESDDKLGIICVEPKMRRMIAELLQRELKY